MKTALPCSPLLLLVACTPSGPATETAEPVERTRFPPLDEGSASW